MTKQHLSMLGLLLGSSLVYTACSDSDVGKSNGAGEAGEAGEPNVGAAGSTPEAGAAGAAGEAGTAGAQSIVTQAPPLNPQAVVVTSTGPATSNHLLVAGTNFTSSTEIANLALATDQVVDTTVYEDGDTVTVASAGIGFALERTNDKVILLNGSKIGTTFDLKNLGTGDAAPIDDKAYVPLLSQSLIVVLDLKTGTVSKRIDLSQYNAASDSDGSADIDAAVYDSTKKIAYFLLGRIDFTTFDASGHLPCSANKAQIVALDVDTDKVVDLNGAAEGEAIELTLNNPGSLSLAADGSLIVLASGCFEGTTRKSQGVEVVDTGAGTTQVVYAPQGDDYLSQLIVTGGSHAVLGTFDNLGTPHWFELDLAAGKLGTELMNVPDAVSFDGKNLLGVGTAGAVVSYDVATDKATTLSATSWHGDYSSAASTSLVK